jgi:hypothetical protein
MPALSVVNRVQLLAALTIVLASCGFNNDSNKAAQSEHISVELSATGQTAVGQPENVHFSVKNIGSTPISL